tara:strand:- start:2087 stop:3334 length:1248 start_codon:yes stop_codon:yes gene_type:complete
MFANLGQQIGGMIQQYGLNKEKQKKNQAFIKGQSNLLDMLSEQDPAQADRYAIMKEQLNNPDVSLTERTELGKQLMQNVTLSNQMQNQMLNRETQKQALGLAKRTEDLTVENLKLGNKQKELGTLLSEISLEELKAIKDEKTRVALLTLKERGKDLLLGDQKRELESAKMASEAKVLPSTTEATIARNETSVMQDEATQQRLPSQTSLTLKQQGVQSRQLDVENQLMDIVGIEGLAQMKADDLKTLSEANKAKLEHTKAYASYIRNKGMADLITAANESSPTFKEKFKPLAELQGTLLSQNVQVPGEGKRVKFSEYLELHNEDSDKYPLTGLAGDLDAQLKTLELSTQNLLREQQVQVNVPDEASIQSEPYSLKQSIENIPAVRANIEAGRKKAAERAKQRRDIFNDPNSNIYLQ